MVMPKKYETDGVKAKAKAYEQKNKDAGNRKISFYLQPAGQQILDQFKNEFNCLIDSIDVVVHYRFEQKRLLLGSSK